MSEFLLVSIRRRECPGVVPDGWEQLIATIGLAEVCLRRDDGRGWLVVTRRARDGVEVPRGGWESWERARAEAVDLALEMARLLAASG